MKTLLSLLAVLACAAAVAGNLPGCSDSTTTTGTDADTDADSDTDSDADTDADGDSDTDADTDTHTGTGTGDDQDAGDYTCEYECHGAEWCSNHSGVVHDEMTCPGDQICCEVIE